MKVSHLINYFFQSITILLIVFFFTSCVSTKKYIYFNDITDTTSRFNSNIPEVIVQPNDILSISVSSINPEAAGIFNTPTGSGTQVNGYLVDKDGFIQFPVLGRIKASGISKTQLRDNITRTILDKKLLVDPIVNIQYLNFKIVVLGEVGRPGVINVPSEKINILEALSMAGDLTIYGKRENVLLIREDNGQRTIKRINLNSKETLRLPYYYLKSNDVLYVEPNDVRIASSNRSQQVLPIIFSGLSAFVTIIYLVTNNN